MNIAGISQFWYPLVKRQPSEVPVPAIIRGIFSIENVPGAGEGLPVRSAEQAGKSRLSPDKRAEMLADLEKRYEALDADPAALAEELEEGVFLDEALNDPIIEE